MQAAPDDEDAGEIRVRTRVALVQAGERAAALAAPEEAQHYLDEAAALAADEPAVRAPLLQRAGLLANQSGRTRDARERLEESIALYADLNDGYALARAESALCDVAVNEGKLDE